MPVIVLSAIILYLAGSAISASFNLAEWSEFSRMFAAGAWLAVSAFWGMVSYLQGGGK